jgi:transposase
MEKCEFTVGVDVSKLTLDISCSQLNQHIQISNDSKGFKNFGNWCKLHGINKNNSLMVMEYTGGYEYRFIRFCELMSFKYCRVSGLDIKNSLGITRGKNDKVDSNRISIYAEEKIKKLNPSKPLNDSIIRLRELLSFRKRLVRENAALKASSGERKHMYEPPASDTILKISKRKIEQNNKDIKAIEKEMKAIILSDAALCLNYAIITSIKGIGPINALMTIAFTENFTSFDSGRAYAVYVGIVPFDHSSGTSIKGRKRVSHLANKELKQELNQAAKTAIIHDPELRAYAEGKLKQKHYKVVLNNVKFKLVQRMFSLVARGEKCVDNYRKRA